jgi:hypothetical protein
MKILNKVFITIGGTGLVITIGTNRVASLVLKKPQADLLSHGWWFSSFPSYIVWLAFLAIGLASMAVAACKGSRVTEV